MALPLVLAIAIVFFVMQLLCCLNFKRMWLRLFPLILAAVLDGLCWLAFLLAKLLMREDTLGFACAILGFVFLYWVAGAILGWGISGIVERVKR